VLGNADLATQPGFSSNTERVANREAVDGAVADVFLTRDREANIEHLALAGIAYGRLSDLEDLSVHPQNRFIRVATENGPVELLSPAAVVRGRQETFGPVPGLGQHGDAIRKEFG
jgi:crotonobetainyl-CoA:carnitine CoA-transferase CaiB-like acyl-CoA transferase